jgi:hypothetical protein
MKSTKLGMIAIGALGLLSTHCSESNYEKTYKFLGDKFVEECVKQDDISNDGLCLIKCVTPSMNTYVYEADNHYSYEYNAERAKKGESPRCNKETKMRSPMKIITPCAPTFNKNYSAVDIVYGQNAAIAHFDECMNTNMDKK